MINSRVHCIYLLKDWYGNCMSAQLYTVVEITGNTSMKILESRSLTSVQDVQLIHCTCSVKLGGLSLEDFDFRQQYDSGCLDTRENFHSLLGVDTLCKGI